MISSGLLEDGCMQGELYGRVAVSWKGRVKITSVLIAEEDCFL